MMLTIVNQTVLRAPFQTIHIPNPHMGYRPRPKPYSGQLFKSSTFPIYTQGTLPSHPHSHSIHRVPTTNQTVLWAPFQTIHIPNPYTRYLNKPSTFPIHTQGTLTSHPHSHSVHQVPTKACSILRAPFQCNHHSNPYTRYLAKLSTIPFHTPGTRPNDYRSTHIL
jgi:hypothetical protein